MSMEQILYLLIFLVPAYVSNSIPVVLGGGTPLDSGIVLPDGERLFGPGKTLRGFFAGVFGGTVAGGIIAILYNIAPVYSFPFFPDAQAQFLGGFILALGAISGDAIGSFIKRRIHFPSGKPFFLDTVFFIAFALLISYPFVKGEFFSVFNILFCLILTAILHPLTNYIANKAGLKKVPW